MALDAPACLVCACVQAGWSRTAGPRQARVAEPARRRPRQPAGRPRPRPTQREGCRDRTSHDDENACLWQTRGHQLEGLHWLRGLLVQATTPTPERLRGLAGFAWLALSLGATDEARSAIAEGLSLGERLEDADGL